MIKKRLILIGILVLLSAALVVGGIWLSGVELLSPEENPDYQFGFQYEFGEKIRIFSFSSKNIDYLEVTNAHGNYRVRMEDNQVYIVNYENVPLLAASSAGLFNSGQTLRLETVIAENCQDMDDFGLEKPQATVNIQAYSGATAKFHIGDMSPNHDYYYMCVDGERTIYLIDTLLAERYLKSVTEYCDRKIYKCFVPFDDLTSLSIKSPSVEYAFRLTTEEEYKKGGIYFGGVAMDKPYAWGGDASAIESLMGTMTELTATSVAAVCVEEKDLAQYGLDAASRTEVLLKVKADPNPTMYNNKTNPYFDSSLPTGEKVDFDVTYWIGNVTETEVYVMFDNRAVVYTMPRDTFYWLDWKPYQFCARLLHGEYLADLSQLILRTPEDVWTFDIANANSNDKDELRVQCGNVAVNNNLFRNFYTMLIGLYPSGEGIKPEGDVLPDLEIEYKRLDGVSNFVRFYAMDARNYAAEVNGVTFLSVRVTEIQKVLSDLQKILKGQDIIM